MPQASLNKPKISPKAFPVGSWTAEVTLVELGEIPIKLEQVGVTQIKLKAMEPTPSITAQQIDISSRLQMPILIL